MSHVNYIHTYIHTLFCHSIDGWPASVIIEMGSYSHIGFCPTITSILLLYSYYFMRPLQKEHDLFSLFNPCYKDVQEYITE